MFSSEEILVKNSQTPTLGVSKCALTQCQHKGNRTCSNSDNVGTAAAYRDDFLCQSHSRHMPYLAGHNRITVSVPV